MWCKCCLKNFGSFIHILQDRLCHQRDTVGRSFITWTLNVQDDENKTEFSLGFANKSDVTVICRESHLAFCPSAFPSWLSVHHPSPSPHATQPCRVPGSELTTRLWSGFTIKTSSKTCATSGCVETYISNLGCP